MISEVYSELQSLLRAGDISGVVEFASPPKEEMGDVAFPCFAIAKQQQKNPAEVAKELANRLNEIVKAEDGNHIVGRVQAFGPYVNFFLRLAPLSERIVGLVVKEGRVYGKADKSNGQRVIIEYPSNNTHKEFHIGHFRNVCIGNTLAQLFSAHGTVAYPVNYLNDFGSHVAKCLWGLEQFHKDEKPPENKQKWLGEIYAEASTYVREHPEAAEAVATLQQRLEAKDKKLWPLFMQTREWSIQKFEELFKELGVEHVAVFYEKDLKADGQKMVETLLKKGIATIGEGGAVIIDLKQYNLDIALVRKSNGTGLYITSDLPLAETKFKKYKADESIVITGQEQTFYFKQLFKILELMGFNKKFTHVNYGLVNLPEGKMSSRTGNVVLYEDLRDQVREIFMRETKVRHPEWDEKVVQKTVDTLTQAALKFGMQKHEAAKNIVFDIKEATSVDGFTGPYVLYAVARIASIARKAKAEKIKTVKQFKNLATVEEKRLVVFMGEFAEVIQKALAQYNPSVIARYAFDLAQAFNDFYNKHSILSAESSELIAERLTLALAVQQVLRNALALLSIDTVEEM